MNFKKFLTDKGITDEKFEAMSQAEQAKLFAEFQEAALKAVTDELAKKANSEAIPDVKKAIETYFEGKYTPEEAKQKITELEEAISKIKDAGQASVFKSFEQQVSEQLTAQAEALKGIKGNKNANVTLTIKAVGEQTTGNVTLPAATPTAYTYQQNPTVIPATAPIPFVQQFTDNGQTNLVSLPWVNEVGQEGDFDFVGEGVLKPLIDIDYEIEYSAAKKVAGRIKVSEEALTDIPFLTSEINRKLRQRHDLALQEGILNGDGTGANLTGITEVAGGFVAGGLAASIENAQNYDVIVAVYNQILVASDSNYIPNAIFMNPTDVTLMKLTKDTFNNYVTPPFVDKDGNKVNGVMVVANTKIPVGYFLAGDFSKSHVRSYVDFSIRIGYGTNPATGESDFERNMLTVLGESRVHHYISENEYKAFVYDQFSVAKAALETV